MHQLLTGTAMAIQPLTLDTMGTACQVCSKLQQDMVRQAPTNVRQELIMAPILASQPVDVRQAMEALKTALQPQATKPPTALASAKKFYAS